MRKISFCINTAKNEKDYILLLLKSLKDNIDTSLHEIIIFIDSDNQNSYEAIMEYKKVFSNFRVYRNTNLYRVGHQRNTSLMINAASNEIVCYLQSDMVVGKDFDVHIDKNLVDDKIVLACARIEPPLHPASPEKIVKDFGVTPDVFRYEEFNKFVVQLQNEHRPVMYGHFAPFAIHKDMWLNVLGGFDTQFMCSREDSDTMIRMKQCGLKLLQTWDACVYHFTCVSSRGVDWYDKSNQEANHKNRLQELADQQELKRFFRKWGYFGHDPKPLYDVSLCIEIDEFVNFELLKAVEPFFKRCYLSDYNVANQLKSQVEFEAHYYSNIRWDYSHEHWLEMKHLFNPTDFDKRIMYWDKEVLGDIIVSVKHSELLRNYDKLRPVVENINQLVDETDEVGTFEYSPLKIEIKNKNDLSKSLAKIDCDTILSGDFIFE